MDKLEEMNLAEVRNDVENQLVVSDDEVRDGVVSGGETFNYSECTEGELVEKLKELLKKRRRTKNFAIRVIIHPTILARLKNEDAELLKDLEESYGKDLSFRADPTLHMEQFKLVDPETGMEY